MKVLSKTLIKESETAAVKSGAFSFRELMLKAGNIAADCIMKEYDIKNKSIAVICGNGNNGGDGCVIAARLLKAGANVKVITPLGSPTTEDAYFYYSMLPYSVKSDTFSDDYDIIIDALFGIGLNRPLSDELCVLINQLNLSNAIKIAIDIPSGAETDTGAILGSIFKADFTVTFIALKPCFILPPASDYCGKTVVADIEVEPVGFTYLTTDEPCFPKRPHNSHKGTFGTALLICGSYGMAGAAILSAKAALRSGLGIARCVLCKSIYSPFTAALPEAVCIPSDETENGKLSAKLDIKSIITGANALLFGCGLSVCEDTAKILENIMHECKTPLVIDADGINLLAKSIHLLKESKAQIILTPHPAEMARLCGKTTKEVESNRVSIARNFAIEYGCTVILKGADTIIAEKCGTVTFNLTGNPGMATGGSGDVLSGILVSLLAQGMPVSDAAKAAVYLHGTAGDKAASKRNERSLIPSDIIDEL